MLDLIGNVTDGVKSYLLKVIMAQSSEKSAVISTFNEIYILYKYFLIFSLPVAPLHLPSRGCRQETIEPSVFSFP